MKSEPELIALAQRARAALTRTPVTVNLLAMQLTKGTDDYDATRSTLTTLAKGVQDGLWVLPGVEITRGDPFTLYGRTMQRRLWSLASDADLTAPAIRFRAPVRDPGSSLAERVKVLEAYVRELRLLAGLEGATGSL